jgi:hypothetical protein
VKKLLKLLALAQAARHGHAAYRAAGARKPWKHEKRKGRWHDPHHGHHPYGYHGMGPGPYGRARPRGLKGVIVEAILHRLLRR